MRYAFFIVIFLLTLNCSFAAIDDNIDYNLINNAFSNPNPTTNQDFENLMKQYENPREGFFTKMFKFFDKDKIKYDKDLKTRFENPNNQPKRIKDVPEEKPTVLISANSVDSSGNKVGVGYYQISYKKQDNDKYVLILTQGASAPIATLNAKTIDEDKDAPAIVYGRAETLNNGYIKVIYANLDLTLLGFLKVQTPEQNDFEPLY